MGVGEARQHIQQPALVGSGTARGFDLAGAGRWG